MKNRRKLVVPDWLMTHFGLISTHQDLRYHTTPPPTFSSLPCSFICTILISPLLQADLAVHKKKIQEVEGWLQMTMKKRSHHEVRLSWRIGIIFDFKL
jgi:hypothetical protein